MRRCYKNIFAVLFFLCGLMLLPVSAGAEGEREVMRIIASSGASKAVIPVYACEDGWGGYYFDEYGRTGTVILEKETSPITVSVEVLDPSLIVADSLNYQKSFQLNGKDDFEYDFGLIGSLDFRYRLDGEERMDSVEYQIFPYVMELSVDNLHVAVGKKGFRPGKNSYLPIQVNVSWNGIVGSGSYFSSFGKFYLRVQVLNSKGKYVYRSKDQNVTSNGYLRIQWDGKASKKNSAGVKAGAYVPNGKYKVEAYLYCKGAKGNPYAKVVKPATRTKTITISSKAPTGKTGTELPVYTGNSEIDYMADRMLKEAGVKAKDSDDAKVRKIYHYMTLKFKHVHYDEKSPKAHFNLSASKTKKAVKKFATKTEKSYKKGSILVSPDVSSRLTSHMATRSGVCNDHADIFALLCKHAGVNAGICNGYYLNRNGTKAGHSWNYAVISGITWYYDVDVEIQNYGKGQGDYYWYKKTRAQANKTHQFQSII